MFFYFREDTIFLAAISLIRFNKTSWRWSHSSRYYIHFKAVCRHRKTFSVDGPFSACFSSLESSSSSWYFEGLWPSIRVARISSDVSSWWPPTSPSSRSWMVSWSQSLYPKEAGDWGGARNSYSAWRGNWNFAFRNTLG